MKITHVISGLGIGGAQTLLLDIAKYSVADHKSEVSVISMNGGEYIESFKKTGVEVIDMHESKLLSMTALGKLKEHLKRISPDIVHTHLHKADFYGRIAARQCGIRGVFSTCHNYSTTHAGVNPDSVSLNDRIDNSVARYSGCKVIAISDIVRQYLIRRSAFFDGRVRLIPNGIDVREKIIMKLGDDEKQGLRNKYGFASNDKVMIILGRLEKQKGHLQFLSAVAPLMKKLPVLKLLILGEGMLKDNIKEYVRDQGLSDSVKLAGFVPESEKFIEASDFVIVPSLWEAFGLSAIEGMIKSKVVIASGVGGLKEIISHGSDGFLFNPDDPDDVCRTVESVITGEYDHRMISENAVRKVKSSYDVRNMVNKYFEYYSADS